MDSRKLLRDILNYAPSAIGPVVLGLISGKLFTTYLSVEDYGRFSLAISIATLGATLSSQWIRQGLGRHLPGCSPEEGYELKRATGLALLGVVAAIGLISVFLGYPVRTFFGTESGTILPAITLYAISLSLLGPLSTVLQGELRSKEYTRYQVTTVALRFCGALVLLLVTRAWIGLVWAYALTTLMMIPRLYRSTGMPPIFVIVKDRVQSSKKIIELATYGVPMIGWFLAEALLNFSDRFIIQFFRGPDEVGVYSAGYSIISSAAGVLAAPVLLAAHPLLMREWSQGDRTAVAITLGRIVDWFVVMGIAVVSLVTVFASEFTVVFLGPQFQDASAVLPVVLGGCLLWQLGMYTQKPLEFVGATKRLMLLVALAAFVNVSLNVLLVPLFGYMAAAYTTLFSYAFYAVITTLAGQRLLVWRVSYSLWGKISLVSMGFVVGLAHLRTIIEIYSGYWLGLLVAVTGAGLYITFLFVKFLRHLVRTVSGAKHEQLSPRSTEES